MSSFGSQIRKRLAELRRAGEDVPKIMMEVAEGATIEAASERFWQTICSMRPTSMMDIG